MSAEPVTFENLSARLDELSVSVIKLRGERDEAVELVTRIAEGTCSCNFETIDGRTVGAQCLVCRASDFLETL